MDTIFAGSYYYVAHSWYGGNLFLSDAVVHRAIGMYVVAAILVYTSVCLISPQLFEFWVLIGIFVLIEGHSWLNYQRGDRYAKVIRNNLHRQVASIRMAVTVHAFACVAFLLAGAYGIWSVDKRWLNEMFLVPAIVLPLMYLSVIGVVLLIMKTIRVLRERRGHRARSPVVSNRQMAFWVLMPAVVFAVMFTSFAGGLVLLAIIAAVTLSRSAIRYERKTLVLS